MSMSADTLWDLYQAKDSGPFWGPRSPAPIGSGNGPRRRMGAGGARGMGAGGVYVRSPDGSMHWDETKADPNPNGGSVIDSGSGKAIPGANRQSGPTGPGGTGPAGSQAQQAHITELQQNPSFAASGTGPGSWLASALDPSIGTMSQVSGAATPNQAAQATAGLISTDPSAGLALQTNTDPKLQALKDNYDQFQRDTWKVGSSLGKVGQTGAGGEQGMGAGGVYVKAPDGTMHWDETKADPNPNGGSVIDSSTGKAIPGANRQSYSSGPGGTGPVGSQAQQLHIQELQQNPSFASSGTGPGSWLASAVDPSVSNASMINPSAASPYNSGTRANNSAPEPGSFSQNVDPVLRDMANKYEDWQRKTWKVGSSLGNLGSGGEGGMGAGDTATMTPSQQASVDLTNKQLDNLMKIAQMEDAQKRDAENNRHNEALAKIQQDYQFHQDDVLLKRAEDAENVRHSQAQEQIQRDQIASNERIEGMREAHEVQIQQMQEGNAIYLQQGQQAYDSWSKGQDQRMQILGSALSNPWLQALSGMSPAPGAAPGTVVGGQNLANLIQQIMQPYDPRAWGVQNAPSVMGLQGSTAGGPSGPAGSMPNVPYAQSTSTLSGGPNWQQWQQMTPFQKAAYRTDVEALGPGVWNQMSTALGNQFNTQGGTPNVTQLQAAGANPADQAGMQMTGEMFGQSPTQFWQGQQRQWSGAQAANVKQNLSGQQNLSGIAA